MQRQAALPATGPFEGLLLGSLIGQGSFGRVYRGLWKGQVVGVKVIPYTLCCTGQHLQSPCSTAAAGCRDFVAWRFRENLLMFGSFVGDS